MDKLEELKNIRISHRTDPEYMLKLIGVIRQVQACRSCVQYFISDTYQQAGSPLTFRLCEISREAEKYFDILEELFEGCLNGPHKYSYQRYENIGRDDSADNSNNEKLPELPDK